MGLYEAGQSGRFAAGRHHRHGYSATIWAELWLVQMEARLVNQDMIIDAQIGLGR